MKRELCCFHQRGGTPKILRTTALHEGLQEVILVLQDMVTPTTFFQKCKLKLSTAKTLSVLFHPNNKEANRELNVAVQGRTTPSCAKSAYIDVKLDRTLTFKRRLKSLHRKLASRVELAKRLTRSSLGDATKILRWHLFNPLLNIVSLHGVAATIPVLSVSPLTTNYTFNNWLTATSYSNV